MKRSKISSRGFYFSYCNLLFYRRCGVCDGGCNDGGKCQGHVANGVKWYRAGGLGQNKGTWGFADVNDIINLYWVDTATEAASGATSSGGMSVDKRLSLHVNPNNRFEGGHRCGYKSPTYNSVGEFTGFDDSEEWELVFYHAY